MANPIDYFRLDQRVWGEEFWSFNPQTSAFQCGVDGSVIGGSPGCDLGLVGQFLGEERHAAATDQRVADDSYR